MIYVALRWADVNDLLNRVVNGLGELDLGPHRRIAVFAENAVETALAHLGALLGGASSVPVNFHLTAEESAYILGGLRREGVVRRSRDGDRGVAAADRGRAGGRWNCPGVDGVLDWEEWLAGSGSRTFARHVPLPNLLYTSGTTGRPKGTELPPTMFAGGGNMTEHLEALRDTARYLRHAPGGRSDVSHRSAVGHEAVGCGRAVGDPEAIRCRRHMRRHRPLSHRDSRDGADPLHPPARAARRREGPLRRVARCGSLPTPAPSARSR